MGNEDREGMNSTANQTGMPSAEELQEALNVFGAYFINSLNEIKNPKSCKSCKDEGHKDSYEHPHASVNNVIEGLKRCSNDGIFGCTQCPYDSYSSDLDECTAALHNDAVYYLKKYKKILETIFEAENPEG